MTTLDIRQLAEQGGVNPIAPVTVPEAVKFENGADLTTAIGSIATIETSPATATHAVGDYIVWNGQLYKVISAIAVGATLTVGTNISATSAGSELKTVKSELINNVTFTPTISSSITDVQVRTCTGTYNTATKLVIIRLMLYSPSGNIPVTGGLIARIPVQYAPTVQVEVPALVIPNGTSWADVRTEALMVQYDGGVRLGNYIYGNVATKWIGATIVYFVD